MEKKIASTSELQNELRRLIAYSKTDRPSRERIASQLLGLSLRVAGIKEITKVTILELDGEPSASVNWIDDKGKRGTTTGKPDGTHMKALIDRAKREKVKIDDRT